MYLRRIIQLSLLKVTIQKLLTGGQTAVLCIHYLGKLHNLRDRLLATRQLPNEQIFFKEVCQLPKTLHKCLKMSKLKGVDSVKFFLQNNTYRMFPIISMRTSHIRSSSVKAKLSPIKTHLLKSLWEKTIHMITENPNDSYMTAKTLKTKYLMGEHFKQSCIAFAIHVIA